MIPVRVNLKVSQLQTVFPLKVNSNNVPISVSLATPIQKINGDRYEGEYVFTPSSETQIINAAGLVMNENVTINPIPSNYGLITWNGSNLLVS